MKKLWFDIETLGTRWTSHGIWQISLIVDLPGEKPVERVFELNPFSALPDNAPDLYYDLCPYGKEELKKLPGERVVHDNLVAFLGEYVNRYDREDKFVACGYNIRKFDLPFLEELFKRCQDKFLYSFIFRGAQVLDVFTLLGMFLDQGVLGNLPGYSLGQVAGSLGIDPKGDLHDALTDIRLTQEVYGELVRRLKA